MICSIDFVARFLFEHIDPEPSAAAISIGDPGQDSPAVLASYPEFCRVEFSDLEPVDCVKHRISLGKLFSDEQALRIVSFVRGLQVSNRPVDLVIHCEAGVSRSAAVALYAAAVAGLDLPEHRDASGANPWVLSLLVRADPGVGYVHVPASNRIAAVGVRGAALW